MFLVWVAVGALSLFVVCWMYSRIASWRFQRRFGIIPAGKRIEGIDVWGRTPFDVHLVTAVSSRCCPDCNVAFVDLVTPQGWSVVKRRDSEGEAKTLFVVEHEDGCFRQIVISPRGVVRVSPMIIVPVVLRRYSVPT